MSGGQRQRVAIARALAIQPAIILADEPTANLDQATGSEILHLMQEINRELKTTFIFSTHDQRVVDLANRLVRIEDGSIQETGVRQEGKWVMAPAAMPPSFANLDGSVLDHAAARRDQASSVVKS
jgi:putative ABC transport system ATP-binding protein